MTIEEKLREENYLRYLDQFRNTRGYKAPTVMYDRKIPYAHIKEHPDTFWKRDYKK